MPVLDYIIEKRRKSPLHFTLIDPDKQSPEEAARLASDVKQFGSDAIMIGGSNPAHLISNDETIKEIKKAVDLPVILFPSTHAALTPSADALFFMSLFNSRSTQYLIEEQVKGAALVESYNLEPLPMAYLIIDSGATTSAGWAGDAKPIPRDKPEFAVGYALAARYFGMKFIYLEAGSGALHPVPGEMISAVKKAAGNGMVVIVGGGIRSAETAREKVQAGADIIVSGTIAEQNHARLKEIINAVKG